LSKAFLEVFFIAPNMMHRVFDMGRKEFQVRHLIQFQPSLSSHYSSEQAHYINNSAMYCKFRN